MRQLYDFISKYDFPLHIRAILHNQVYRILASSISTIFVRVLLKVYGCYFGRNLVADGIPIINITRKNSMSFGYNCRINSRSGSNLIGKSCRTIFDTSSGGKISFGNNSGCSFTVISSMTSITIGDHVKIGGNVRIYDHDYHSVEYMDRRAEVHNKANIKTEPISIGNDVFIGVNTIILKGVTIGDRAILCAGSVLSQNVPADEVWGGNPAVFIKRIKKHQSKTII